MKSAMFEAIWKLVVHYPTYQSNSFGYRLIYQNYIGELVYKEHICEHKNRSYEHCQIDVNDPGHEL